MAKKEKEFSSSLFGYKKKTVRETVAQLREENEALKAELLAMQQEKEKTAQWLMEERAELELSKKKIAEAYMDAQKKADDMVEAAKKEIAIERHNYEVENEGLREIIVERKEAIRNIRLSVQSFSTELEAYFEKVIKGLSSDIDVAVKQLDYTHLEKISADPQMNEEEDTLC